MTTVIFSHGQESGPWGTKIRAMAELAREMGCDADSIDYQGIADPTERVEKLLAEVGSIDDTLVLVGSSMGGHVATAAASVLCADAAREGPARRSRASAAREGPPEGGRVVVPPSIARLPRPHLSFCAPLTP